MTTCIPRAQGVPGLSTAPNWFDSNPGAPPLRNVIDDPRWVGAYNRGDGYGTGLEAQFRGLYMAPDWRGKTSLFLSWEVLYDGSLDNGLDRLYVGFNNGGSNSTDMLLLKVVAYNSSSSDLTDVAAGSIQALNMDPATGLGAPLANPPNWVTQTRVWLTRTPISWTINMYVPYDPAAAGLFSDNGIKLPDPFNMFYEIYVLTPTRIGGSTAVGGFVPHKWPLTAANVFTGLNGDVYPHPATATTGNNPQWDSFHLSTGPGDPICPTTGWVSVDSYNIGNMVDGGAPNIVVKYSQVAPFPVNTIFANVNNQTGGSIPAGGIKAHFRIADWGSNTFDPHAPWDDIRGGANVSNAMPIPTGLWPIAPSNPPPLSFNWTLNATEIAPYLAGKPSDQCLLVELTGANITFLSDSARNNLLVQPASEVKKTATISVEGLAPIPNGGPNRDVYVAVETVNMPAPSSQGGKRGDGMAGVPIWDEKKLAVLRERGIATEILSILASRGLIEALATGKVLLGDLLGLAPVYRVHVYHDTGQHLTVNNIHYPILEPQSSFGLVLDHTGLITGWEHSLDFPPGALQDQITPAFSRIWVPNNDKINVSITVRPVEPNVRDLIGCILAVIRWLRSLFSGNP